jgi:iron complex transport system ATP-binding protein
MDEGRMVAAGPPADVMTSSILSAVYKHPIDVLPHPTREGLLVLPKVADPSDRRGPAST